MRAELLPAGVVLLGGTSLLTKIEYYFRFDLKLPIGNALRNLRASEKFYVDDIKYAQIVVMIIFLGAIVQITLHFKHGNLYYCTQKDYHYSYRDWETALYRDWETDRKSTRLNSSHSAKSRMPSSA